MRKILYKLIHGRKDKDRWSASITAFASEKLISLKHFIPAEFARKPRSLSQIKSFKATEYRQILLYTGIVVLDNIVSTPMYKAFTKLHCAIFILLGPTAHDPAWNDFAKRLLSEFVVKCSQIFGNQFLVYNVHNLIHIADDALKFGSLENCSAFDFENYNQFLKRMIRKNNQELVQVCKRISERDSSVTIRTRNENGIIGDLRADGAIRKYRYQGFVIGCNSGDNCFMTRSGSIVLIQKIIKAGPTVNLECNILDDKAKLDCYPCDSRKLGIYVTDINKTVSNTIQLSNLLTKCVLLPMEMRHIVIPFPSII
jgi:hypothetical protein